MTPSECPRYDKCNAPLCPLGKNASTRGYHRSGEKVCFYLLASGKAGAQEKLGHDPAFQAVMEVAHLVQEDVPSIGKQVAAASQTPFRQGHRRQ